MYKNNKNSLGSRPRKAPPRKRSTPDFKHGIEVFKDIGQTYITRREAVEYIEHSVKDYGVDIVKAGAIPALVSLLSPQGYGSHSARYLKAYALAALSALVLAVPRAAIEMAKCRGVVQILNLLLNNIEMTNDPDRRTGIIYNCSSILLTLTRDLNKENLSPRRADLVAQDYLLVLKKMVVEQVDMSFLSQANKIQKNCINFLCDYLKDKTASELYFIVSENGSLDTLKALGKTSVDMQGIVDKLDALGDGNHLSSIDGVEFTRPTPVALETSYTGTCMSSKQQSAVLQQPPSPLSELKNVR